LVWIRTLVVRNAVLLMQEMKEACSYLNVADYRLFSMALTQRYISPLKGQ
jgi:hypothetical protein